MTVWWIWWCLRCPKARRQGWTGGPDRRKKEKLLAAAHRFLAKKDQDQRDQFVADIAAKKRSLIVEKVSALAEKKGVTVQICDISVRKI